jgi:hypothetical protein
MVHYDQLKHKCSWQKRCSLQICGFRPVSQRIDPGYSRLPSQRKNNNELWMGILLACGVWLPFASVVLTIRFPVMWLGVGWEPGTPTPAVWAWVSYSNPLFELNPQTPKCCHMDLWSARLVLIYLHRHRQHPSLLQQHLEFRVSVLSFLPVVLFR